MTDHPVTDHPVTEHVVVVGGGLAGASAALYAADAGARVTLLERRTRLGGLTWSFKRRGLWFDNGQHVFLRCCTAYLAFLRRIGAQDQVAIQPRLDVPVVAPGGRRASIRRSGLPAPLHMIGSVLGFAHLNIADRLRLVRAAEALRHVDPADPALDAITFAAWLAEHGQRPAAIERFWNLVTLPTLNVPADEASMALAAMVFRTGLLDTADGGDIGWSRVPLAELHGANIEMALDQAGVEREFDVRVDAVRRGPDSSLTVSAGERTWSAPAVVVATSHQTAADILPPGTLGPVEGLGLSPILNVHLVLDRKVTDLGMAACIDSPLQFLFDRTEASGLKSGQYLAVSISAADAYVARRPAELVSSFHAALGEVFPLARGSELVDGTVSREPGATFRGIPGTAALRPAASTSIPGLAVAGAWCDTGWPATMEGAVRSGTAAAQSALGLQGSRSPIGAPDSPLEHVA